MAPLVRDRSGQVAKDNQSDKNIKSYVHVMIIIYCTVSKYQVVKVW